MPSSSSVARPPASAQPRSWRAPWLWRVSLRLARWVVPLFCRLQVSGDVPPGLRGGALILAPNHIGNIDPVVVTAACGARGLTPRMMATAGLFRVPVVGALLRACGHIRVDRYQTNAGAAAGAAVTALRNASTVLVYPEGRITLDPGMWPERAKSGLARMALDTAAVVVPVAQWGAHEVMAYHGGWIMVGRMFSALWRRPRVRVHFGAVVDLSDLRADVAGHVPLAGDRVMAALTRELAAIRADEPRLPRYVDWTRPLSTTRSRGGTPEASGTSGGPGLG